MDVAPGASAEAVFETPDVFCAAALTDRPMVGACRLDAPFAVKAACVGRIAPAEGP